MKYENDLINKINKENKIQFKEQVIQRIKHRIELIESELKQGSEQQQPPESIDIKNEKSEKKDIKMTEEDAYEEKSEKFHNPAKFFFYNSTTRRTKSNG